MNYCTVCGSGITPRSIASKTLCSACWWVLRSRSYQPRTSPSPTNNWTCWHCKRPDVSARHVQKCRNNEDYEEQAEIKAAYMSLVALVNDVTPEKQRATVTLELAWPGDADVLRLMEVVQDSLYAEFCTIEHFEVHDE